MTNCDTMLSEYKTRVGNLFPSLSCCVLSSCKAQALIIQVLWEHGVVWKSMEICAQNSVF